MADLIGVGIFRFKKRKGLKAADMLREHVALISEFKGCKEAWLSRCNGDNERYMLFSRWETMDDHIAMEAALKENGIGVVDFAKLSKYMKDTPHFGVYKILK